MNIHNKTRTVIIVLQIFFTITSTCGEPLTTSKNETNESISNKTVNKNKTIKLSEATNQVIAAEGGTVQYLSPSVQFHGREHEIDTKVATSNVNKNITQAKTKQVSAPPPDINATTPLDMVNERTKLFDMVSEKNDHKKTVPRKGVDFNNNSTNSSTTNISTTTVKPKLTKPTVTVGADDAPYAPSNFETSKTKINSSAQNIPKVPSVERMTENQHEGSQKYVLPIVVVILSVPFVAILISVLYKRGTEWWEHRHYRRMDFLINGMYDN